MLGLCFYSNQNAVLVLQCRSEQTHSTPDWQINGVNCGRTVHFHNSKVDRHTIHEYMGIQILFHTVEEFTLIIIFSYDYCSDPV